jgi:hypothetical protein
MKDSDLRLAESTQKQPWFVHPAVPCYDSSPKTGFCTQCDIVLPLSDSSTLSFTSSGCLRLLPRLPVTSVASSILPSIMCFEHQFLCKMWPMQLAFLLFIALASSNTSSFLTQSVQLIFSILLQHNISTLSGYFCYTFRTSKFRT